MKSNIPYAIMYVPTSIYCSAGSYILYKYQNFEEYITESHIWIFCLGQVLCNPIKGFYICFINDVIKSFLQTFGMCIFLSTFEIIFILWGLYEYNYPFTEYNSLYYFFLVSITINLIYLIGLLSIPFIVLIYKHFYQNLSQITNQTTP